MTVVTGDANANNLTGTAGDDTLIGLGGNDTLNGGAGNDTLDGGTGNDYLYGGDGIDTAYYGASSGGFIVYMDTGSFVTVKDVGNTTSTGFGLDRLALDIEYIKFSDLTLNIASLNLQLGGAGWGTTYYYGTTAANVQAGTQAKDVMYGGDGNDSLNGPNGSAGDDTLSGENGNDSLYGGDGNDLLDGGEGSDYLSGGAGNDTLNAGRGNDNIYGGADIDTLVYDAASSNFIIYRDAANNIVVRDMADTTVTGFGLDRVYDDVEFIQFSDLTLNVSTLNLQIGGEGWGTAYFYGTAANNAITGTQAADVMYGGDGNDILNGSAGSAGNDTLYGENGNDTLNGGVGSDVLEGGADNDTLNGQADNDTLYGGDGSDTLNGGEGSDYLDGGNGVDMAMYINETSGVTVNLGISGAQNTGASGMDTLVNIENVTGSAYDDVLSGNADANRLVGGNGNDTLYGMDGDDTLEGNAGNDTLSGGNGEDTLNGGFGDDYIDGGAGNNTVSYSLLTGGIGVGLDLRNTAAQNTTGAGVDTVVNVQNIIGSSYADVFIGTDQTNRINGAVGSDTIYGEGGDDYLEGGSNNDTLYGGDGNDTLDGGFNDDYLDGEAGSNYASYASASTAVTVDLSISGAQYTGAGGGTDTLVNIQNLRGSNFNDTLIGDAGDNKFIGGLGDDYIDGGAGLDSISYEESDSAVYVNLATGVVIAPAQGSDTLVSIEGVAGSRFDDTLIGDAGNNLLEGGLGNDTLDGGAGNDIANYRDLTTGVTVDLSVTTAQNFDALGNDVLVNIEGIRTGSGDDTIIGTAADNVLDAGAGVDTVSYANATAGVTVNLALATAQNTVGAGTDTLSGFENITGSAFNDTLAGSTGVNNVINGGAGFDATVLSGNWVDYAISYVGGNYVLQDRRAVDGTDTYISVERFVFADQAIDVSVPSDLLNDTPIDIMSSADSLYDDTAANALVATLTTDDPDINDVHTYSIVGGAAASSFYITADSLYLASGGLSGYAAGSFMEVTLRTTDASGAFYDETFYYEVLGSGLVLIGTPGVDTLIGGNGDDTISALGSNDYVDGGLGNDTMDGGTGIDMLSYSSAPAGVTVSLAIAGPQNTGGAGIDTISNFENLTGSNFNDTLTGDANNNTIYGLGGNDTIDGGAGNDVLDGGAGIDTASYASATAAVVVNLGITAAQNTGGSGTDTITGFEALIGSAFNDTLTGSAAADTIIGGAGSDTIAGLAGDDVMDGGLGADTLNYSAATAGVTINLNQTTAQNTGGAGIDTISNFENIIATGFNDNITANAADNSLNGGAGIDTVSYASATAGVAVSLAVATAQSTGGSGVDTLTGFENLTGSGFNDTLTGDGNANIMIGGAGNDTIDGGLGNDTIDGGLGNDILNGNTGIDILTYATATAGVTVNMGLATAQNTVGAGIDTISGFEVLTGSNFNDTLLGSAGADTISGGSGDDTIAGLAGNDILDGGAGSDTLDYSAATAAITLNLTLTTGQNTGGAGTDTISNFENIIGGSGSDLFTLSVLDNYIDGGAGTDEVSYAGSAAGVTVNLSLTTAQNTGGSGVDTLLNIEDITGTSFNDTLYGSAGVNVIDGGLGDDYIDGGAGNDTLIGGTGIDTLSYAAATAGITINISKTNAQNTGGAGTDKVSGFENLTGSGFNDVLTGTNSSNYIYGGAGNDTISGGGGADTLEGGAGADVINGGNGADILAYYHDTAGVVINLATNTASGGHAQGDTISSLLHVTGGAGNDTLTGTTGNNTLDGSAGNDLLDGGSGTDVLYGGLDNDILIGGAGNDILNGGAGADIFQFSVGGGVDTIQDFSLGNFGAGLGDALDIADILSGFNPGTSNINDFVHFTTSGSNTIVSVDANGLTGGANFTQVATLQGVTGLSVSALYADGEIIVT